MSRTNQVLESHNEIIRIFAEVGEFKSKATKTVRLARETEPGLHLAAAAGPRVREYPPLPVFTEAQAISTAAFTEGKRIVIDDYVNSPAASQQLVEMGMQSMLILPINGRGRILGLVTLISGERSHFDTDLVDRLNTVVDGLGIIIENSILQDESETIRQELEQLTAELSLSNSTIIQSNELLEERVKIRTQELEAANNLAMRSHKLAMIGQLSGGIAHDLRNPLGAINNAVYFLKRKLGAEPTQGNVTLITEYVELIGSEVVHANDVISNLLSFGSEKEIVLSRIEVSNVINQAMVNFVLRENIELSIDVDSDVPLIFGDSSQLVRVVQNLIGNAQDAMENGGRLRIWIHRSESSVEI